MTQPDEARLPQMVEGIDMRALPLAPEDAFVLSRIDGHTSEAEIAMVTGLEPDQVHATLRRLVDLGAVRFDAPEPRRPEPAASQPPPGVRLTRPVVEATELGPIEGHHPAAALYDPAELDEEVDLDLPRKRTILDQFYRLDSVTHYELLSVDESADKKAVKDAYFATVSVFHPDRYFGKRLGNFKVKLERVFQRLTEAHDVLTRARPRSEYDAYLETQRRSKRLENALGDERTRAREIESAQRAIEERARMNERASNRPTPASVPVRPLAPEERRRALARKLGSGSMPPPGRSSAPPSSARSPVVQEVVADDLKRRYEQRLTRARDEQISRYVEAADLALAEKNVVSAANALRIAVSLVPDDEALKQRLDDVQERANGELADTYLEKARYEEQNGRMLEAAASYERAARGKPNAQIFERAAHCLVECDGDLRKAADLAKKAASLAPRAPGPRVTLARAYVKAGMKESALLEFERAAQLSPEDDTIKDWVKRLKRGEV